MSIPTYRTGFPQDGSSLGSTKAQIRANLDGTFMTLGVDHINNNGSPGTGTTPGYHNVIHFQNQSGTPSNVANITQLYTNTLSNAQQLMLKSRGNNTYQLTNMLDGSYSTFAENPGWSWLPGGLIMQWGKVTTNLNVVINGTVTPPVAFTGAVYSIQLTPTYTQGSAPNGGCALTATPTNANPLSQFVWQAYTSSSSYTGFYWVVIGF